MVSERDAGAMGVRSEFLTSFVRPIWEASQGLVRSHLRQFPSFPRRQINIASLSHPDAVSTPVKCSQSTRDRAGKRRDLNWPQSLQRCGETAT